MPVKARRPCNHPGCRALIGAGRYCEPHQIQVRKELDRRRGSAASRGYDAAWRRVRAQVLREEPLCRLCAAQGRVTAAEVVDHEDGNSRNNARANLRPLCKRCHDARTARDQGFGRKRERAAGGGSNL